MRRGPIVVIVVALSVATGCGDEGPGPLVGAQPVVQPSIHPLPPPTTAASAADDEVVTLASFVRRGPEDAVLSDPAMTPGAVFDDVVAADICQLHYTMGVRQPRFNDKVVAFANYGISIRDRDVYQVDHLVPISLGGSNDPGNLWPQPYDDVAGAEQKDLLERQLRGLVCTGTLELAVAQHDIAADWWKAYEAYMGLPIAPGSAGPEPWVPPSHGEGEVVNGGVCDVEGGIGYAEPKHIRLTCTMTSFGELRWQKRY